MIPNPIHKVLSSIQKHQVRALLMGGQACVLYGASALAEEYGIDLERQTARDEAAEEVECGV